ncbi:unnamed protein product, partial [marine sediment metagenome]
MSNNGKVRYYKQCNVCGNTTEIPYADVPIAGPNPIIPAEPPKPKPYQKPPGPLRIKEMNSDGGGVEAG